MMTKFYPQVYRTLLLLILLSLESGFLQGQVQADEASDIETRPNIIFLLADDQCTYSMGCYGTPGAKTPNLDAMAREGMTFDCHYDTTAICMASRVSIMTGLFEYRHACNFDTGNLLVENWQQSYPSLLRKAGYRTGFAGKFGFTVCQQANGKGVLPEADFDAWGGGPGQTSYATAKNESMKQYAKEFPHSTLSYGAFAKDFIAKSQTDSRPFCLSISFKAPHHPVQPDPRFDAIYEGASFIKPSNFGRAQGEHFSMQSRQGRQYERFHSWDYSSDYDGVMAKYYQQIYAIDFAVGMIRDELRRRGLADNTVIIYTSDNGFMCGSHGYGSKVLPYEESTRVPLIIFDPSSATAKGKRCSALTGNVDMAATILEFAGLTVPEHMDGRSVRQLLDDPTTAIHEQLPLMNVWGPQAVHSFAVVTQDAKLIFWPYSQKGMQPTTELYDLSADRLETNNSMHQKESKTLQESMEKRYEDALAHWRKNGAKHHGYPQFAEAFRRPN